jgi:hypothetical protein
MLVWDYLKTLIQLRLVLQPPCICAGCERGRSIQSGHSRRFEREVGMTASP